MLPHVIVHNAISVDGRMDWFSGDLGQYYALAGQFNADGMLAGSNTILAAFDSSETDLTDENKGSPEPNSTDEDVRQILVVVDSRGRIPNIHLMRHTPYWRDLIVLCSKSTPKGYLSTLRQHEINFIQTGDVKVDLREALDALNTEYGINSVRVDSGGVLNGALLRAGLVDEVSVLITPALVGGTTPKSMFSAPDLESDQDVISLILNGAKELEDGFVWLRYDINK